MSKCKNSVVISFTKAAGLELCAGAAAMSEKTSLICMGEKFSCKAVTAAFCPESDGQSVFNTVKPLVELVKGLAPALVLVEQCVNGRYIAAAVAAAFGTSVQCDVQSICFDGAFITKRLAYGGAAVNTETSGCCAVICAGSGLFEPAEEADFCGECFSCCESGVKLVERKEKQQQRSGLASAKRVIGLGRGISSAEGLAMSEQLAQVLGAELGCTRPVAEEDKLMPRSSYIGVSGCTIRPELYLALGVSGQVQHTVGISESGLIVAVNKDEHAAIFSNCDLGIVGDVNEIVPKLIEALK